MVNTVCRHDPRDCQRCSSAHHSTQKQGVKMADVANGGADEMDTEHDNPMGGVTYMCGGEYSG